MEASIEDIFTIKDQSQFDRIAIEIFQLQSTQCDVYRSFIQALRIDEKSITHCSEIPCMPVSFFKTHRIVSNSDPIEIEFSSSATTGMTQSIHAVTDLSVYERSFLEAFTIFYGAPEEYCILALLPAYQERQGSSLIYMVDELIRRSGDSQSGYFLNENKRLFEKLQALKHSGKKTILIGVTYALLDFLDIFKLTFPELIVMETGGMKGRRKEIVRDELHQILCSGFGVSKIHSEYGMTELLSQAYSAGDGKFSCPPWMQIKLRDVNDPLSYIANGKTGGINVIDLANIHSCSFIATQDLGRIHPDDQFEVLGRFDDADIRGCNLLVQ